jgi:GTP pyrophosphokinase
MQVAVHAFESAAAGLPPEDQARLREAVDFATPLYANRKLASGEALMDHALGLTAILATLRVDIDSRMAAILFAADDEAPVEDKPLLSHAALQARFGEEVSRLVSSFRQLIRVGEATRAGTDESASRTLQLEALRKMLLAMAGDIRVVLMRLASRLQTLRFYAAAKADVPGFFARETLDVYAPLANRLGIWQIKWEMEDLAFRFLDPARYKRIAQWLEEKRSERETFIVSAIDRLKRELEAAGIAAEVSGRPKHIYSIHNKMRGKDLDFARLMDIRAFRVIVEDVRSCYAVLGILHDIWQPIPKEFDDYISRPKPNGYRSLHTALIGEDGRPFEVQVRTREMHQHAEFGVAAHWRYKEAGAPASAEGDYESKIAWIRQLLAWKADVATQGALPAEQTRVALQDDRIYVLTPQARVIELPVGATPVDFAYHVHTDLGHRCRGARVDGAMVPLNTPLKNGQTVAIVTTKAGGPSRDWLNSQLGYLRSQRSKAKVRAWFNAIELQETIAAGRVMVDKELQRLGKTAVNLEHLAERCGFARADDMYISVAKDEYSLRHLEDALLDKDKREPEEPFLPFHSRPSNASVERAGKSGVLVVGVDALMTQLAKCCRPAPPDPILGFVTRGRGVSIHRADCPSMHAMAARHPERIIETQWGAQQETRYPVDIFVLANDRQGLLRDISEVFSRERINVVGVNTQSKQLQARMSFTAEVSDTAQLSKALAAIREVPGVTDVERR